MAFLALAALFLFRLGSGDPSRIPSALIGRPAPATSLPPLPGLTRDGAPVPGIVNADFTGAVTLLNVWASWCVPCHDEAPLLMKLAEDKRIRIVGINYKDQPDNARRFIGRHGNPFVAVGTDANGRASIDWGVYGVPETFLIGRDGRIAYKLVGPITPGNLEAALKPAIEKAVAADKAGDKRAPDIGGIENRIRSSRWSVWLRRNGRMAIFLFQNGHNPIEYCATDTRSGHKLPGSAALSRWHYHSELQNALHAAVFGVMNFEAAKQRDHAPRLCPLHRGSNFKKQQLTRCACSRFRHAGNLPGRFHSCAAASFRLAAVTIGSPQSACSAAFRCREVLRSRHSRSGK